MLFGKPKKLIIYPKLASIEVYVDRTEQNLVSFPISLYKDDAALDLQPLNEYLKKEKPSEVVILLSEEVMSTKSFVYDTKTTMVDKQEVIKLALDTVNFEIDNDNVEFSLEQTPVKTIIQADLFQRNKFKLLEANLLKLNSLPDKVEYLSVARAISRVVNNFYKQEYFCLYQYDRDEHVLILSKGDMVYLTNKVKGTHPDLQKTINYSNLYFDKTVNRLFHVKSLTLEYKASDTIEKADFDESSIATQLKLPANFPLPVLGALIPGQNHKQISKKEVIPVAVAVTPQPKPPVQVFVPTENLPPLPVSPSTPSMTFAPPPRDAKKSSSLPIVVVFLVTLLPVSGLVWYLFNRDENQIATIEVTPTPMQVEPTAEPTVKPTLAPVNKALKFQVLNGTDINGQASVLKEKLLKLEFKSVATGNSPTKATENTIKVKKKYAELEEYFKQELTVFPATFDANLSDTSQYDVVMTIGTEITADSAVTTTSKPTPTVAE